LDRYADFAEYAAAKARVFANQREKDWAVLNADDPGSAPIQPGGRCVRFSRRGPVEGGVWLEGEVLFSAVRETRREVVSVGELPVTGAANVENALAALAAADCLGVDPEAVRTGLQRFEGLPHRMELVAEAAGTRWIDDSKGTNVDAVQKSVEAFSPESIILILGGRDKHGGFAALRPAVSRAARCVLTIGEAAPLIESALAGAAPIERVGDMAAAVARAVELVRPGDTVLLSPACASFDQYANFEERGRHFARLAREAASQAMKRET
jgi:UDP-N-acetylmuramoylalanine--D-glutamate ligase